MDSLFDQYDNIVVFDVETTGLDCKTDEIIELAAVRVRAEEKPYRVEEELDVLIRLSGEKRLPGLITGLTGITEQMLLQTGVEKDVAGESFARILNHPKTLVVAYNAQFDLCFLYYLLSIQNRAEVLKRVKLLDAMTVYKDRRDYPHKLSDAVSAYSLSGQNTHRAIDDAKATLELLLAMTGEKDDLTRYINIFGYNPKYGVPQPKISTVTYVPQAFNRRGALYESAESNG